MISLNEFSDDELAAEIARRAEEKKQIPRPLSKIDWKPLEKYIKSVVSDMAEGKPAHKDFEHWIFESAVEAIYGAEFWKWWNKRCE